MVPRDDVPTHIPSYSFRECRFSPSLLFLLPAGSRRDVTVAARHVALIRPGAAEAQSDDTYEVDDCFGSDLGTAEAYKRVLHPSVKSVVDGFNAAALTMGCTGSGKSTLLHGRSGDGTARLAIKALFEALHNKAAHVGLALSQHKASGGGGQAMEFAVDASFCEVYEERVRDLFAGDNANRAGKSNQKREGSFLEVEESSDEGWHVAGLTNRSAPDAQSLQQAYAAALNQRVTGLSEYGHSKHDRAASILTLKVSQYVPGLPERDGSMTPSQHLVNTLIIADCPGAEPLAMDPAVLRLREGARLNRAVLSMAGVVRALATQRREFAGHGDSVLTKVLSEPLGGNCSTTFIGTLKLGEWERSAAVMDLLENARRATTFPVVNDDAARGLQQRLRSRMLQINDARETYREQVQSTGADGIDPQNIGLQMAKLHELEGRLLEERGDKVELLQEKEALLERLQRLNGMDKENLAEKEELQAALIRSEEDRLEIARALVEVQLEANEAQLAAEKTRHDLVERVHELEARAIASEVRVKGAEQGFGEMREKSGGLEVKNEQLRLALQQTREELETDLTTLRSEHADVMGEVGGLKAQNADLIVDVDELRKRLAYEQRRAEEAEAERDDFRAVAEKEGGTLQKKVEAAERAAEEAIATAEASKNRLVSAAEQERDEAVAAAKISRENAVKAAQEERDEEVSKARAAKDRAVDDIRKEMKALVFEARREKEEAVAAAHADKTSTTAYLENDRDARVAKAEKDKEEAVQKAQRDMLSAVAEAHKERDEAVEKADKLAAREVTQALEERDNAVRKFTTETTRLRELADTALSKIDGATRALEASKSNENRARVEADRALGECAQLKEKLETSRAEYTSRINEYMLQVGELERGAQVLQVDPNSEHVLRPSQLSDAAQAMAKDLHRAAAAQVAEYRHETEQLHDNLVKTQRDLRALYAGYRALRHRYEDVAPVVITEHGESKAAAAPHEDEILKSPPTPAQAKDSQGDTRGLASKLADLKEENAKLSQALRLAALDGRGPLAPANANRGDIANNFASGDSKQIDSGNGDSVLFFDGEKKRSGELDTEMTGSKPAKPQDTFGFTGGHNDNARLRAENSRLQQAIDSLKKVRPSTSEEDVQRENGKLKVQLAALANMDKTRAQLAHELAEIKTKLSEKEKEILDTKNHNARNAFTEQRAAIKEFTTRVQAELEKENRNLQTRSAMAEEQIKEINAYMAQSTLAYQKEIMRLRSIIQATAPERLRSPRGLGQGGGGGGQGNNATTTLGEKQHRDDLVSKSTAGLNLDKMRKSTVGFNAVSALRSSQGRNNAPAVDRWVNDGH